MKASKQNKAKPNSQIQRTDRWLPEGKGDGCRGKGVKGVSCRLLDGNSTFGSDHFVLHTHVGLHCCSPETYRIKKFSYYTLEQIFFGCRQKRFSFSRTPVWVLIYYCRMAVLLLVCSQSPQGLSKPSRTILIWEFSHSVGPILPLFLLL